MEELKAGPRTIADSAMIIAVMYMTGMFLIVYFGMITTAIDNSFCAGIFALIVVLWLVIANFIIAIRLRRFRNSLSGMSADLLVQFGELNNCFAEQYRFQESEF